ncbi:autotransporter domain-containing protein [Devosia sp. XK-2]|uniref:autotransporter outer membrane beta-barrel domain-containing protein n=1 Tax=Devosia sp. XK-2 TaxID=3126689 RepID=UPI0030CF6514
MTSTALGLFVSYPAHAQQVIEGGASETVIGGGGGTQPDPWNVGDDLTIGDNGTGTLTITNGGGVVSDTGRIGYDSTGTVTVDDLGSTWDLQGNSLYVGIAGAGNLNITDGAEVQNGSGIIGDEAGSEGVVNVNGGNAAWINAGGLIVGNSGEATLNITNSGDVSNSTARIGDREGSLGHVNVDGLGSTWVSTAGLHVGDQGEGLLSISNRGVVNSNSGVIGASTDGFGHVRVDLATWTIANTLDVGNDGIGRLDISNSGTVTNGNAIVGSAATSHGIVTVEDLGTVWNNADLVVGESGIGEVNIINGGTVNGGVGSVGTIGAESDGVGIVTVSGGNWNGAIDLRVGLRGRGTLAISGAGSVNTATGSVATAPGGVGEVTVHGIGSNWTTTGSMVVGRQGDGMLTLSNGGRVMVGSGQLTLADAVPTIGTLNIGAGDAAGQVDALTVDGGSGTAIINFNHNEANYYFTNDGLVAGTNVTITGSTTVNHMGSGTTVLRGNNTYTGGTTVSNGTLRNMGLVGDVVVNGGIFGGDGTAGAVTINSDGTLAPGNSIGVMTAASATFNAGSTYEIELDDGGNLAGVNNDVLNVTGVADINGGTVHVMPENGTDDGSTYTPGTTYTIMTAAGGVNGEFDSVSDGYAFLYFTLDYDANTVFLNSELATSFCLGGMSDNQCATGDGTFSLGVGNSVFDAVAVLTNTEAPIALDQLSGEIHASAKTALLEDSRFPREAAMDRLRVALGGVGADDNAQIEDQVSESSGLWGQGFGSWSRWNSDGNAAATGRNIGGLFMGGDALVWDKARFGVLGGYSRSSFSVDDRASSGTADTYTLGVYGGGEWDAFTMTGGAAHSWHSLDTSRSVAFSGFSDSLSASYSARTLQAWGEAAYSFEAGAARFEPFANLAYVNLSTDGFTESGGAAALSAASNTLDATFTMLGLRAETDLALGDEEVTLRGMVGWRHAFGDVPTSQMSFASGGDDFAIAGVPLAQDTLVLEAGLDLNLRENSTLVFTYGGQFGSRVQDHSAKASLSVRF